jgi:hypothetical protein
MSSRTDNYYLDAVNYQNDSRSGANGKYENDPYGVPRIKWNNYTRTRTKQSGNASGPPFPGNFASIGVAPPFTFPSSLLLEAQSKLADDVRKHSFNLAVNIAQGKQMTNMVLDNLKLFGHAVKSARRGNFVDAIYILKQSPRGKRKFVSKDISGRWLELQYGWLPMISDSFEAAKAFGEANKVRMKLYRGTKVLKVNFNSSTSPPNFSGLGVNKKRVSYLYEMSEGGNLSWKRSLGLTDPLSVAWEILPWSFVIDWFLPIGTYLESLNTIPHLVGRFSTSYKSTFNSSASIPANTIYYKGAKAKFEYFRLERSISTSLSVPFPSFASLDGALSPKRIYNAIALAHQRFKA